MITPAQSTVIADKLQRKLRAKVLGNVTVDCQPRGTQMDIVITYPYTPEFYEIACLLREKARKYFYYVSVSGMNHEERTTTITLFCSGIIENAFFKSKKAD